MKCPAPVYTRSKLIQLDHDAMIFLEGEVAVINKLKQTTNLSKKKLNGHSDTPQASLYHGKNRLYIKEHICPSLRLFICGHRRTCCLRYYFQSSTRLGITIWIILTIMKISSSYKLHDSNTLVAPAPTGYQIVKVEEVS